MNSFSPGLGGLPKLTLATPAGARAEVYQHGAQVTSWIPPDGLERLFLSRTSLFRSGTAIRGGVPICFPQFSSFGPLPKHGFARTIPWESIQSDQGQAQFRLQESDATRQVWPHAFDARFTITLTDTALDLNLKVTNTDLQPFTFTAALHTYLKIPDIQTIQIAELKGVRYFDQVTNQIDQIESDASLAIAGETDRVYYHAPNQLTVHDSAYRITLLTNGFSDAVIWNPWIEKSAALSDLEPEGYRRMLCVEAAVVGQPVTLQPGQIWSGSQTIHA